MKDHIHKAIHKYIFKSGLEELCNEYSRTQFYTYDDIKKYQWKRFLSLINHANDTVPYYRDLFRKLKIDLAKLDSKNDLKQLPFLTKDIIRSNLGDLISEKIQKNRIQKNSTSGSTGHNLYFYSDSKQRHGQALQIRADSWMGINIFDKEIKIWGTPFELNNRQKIISSFKQRFKNVITLSGYNLSDELLMNQYLIIKKYKPKLITSYPSILYMMANFYERNKLEPHQSLIKTGGEKLYDFQRDKIENIFNTKVYNLYGGRDIPLIAQECSKHEGLHIMMENVLLEVVDDYGQAIEEGEGELVLTHLNNFVMPFIRYKIGDKARITKRMCSCGRGLPLIEEVLGRTFDIIECPNGKRVGGTFWTLLMRTEKAIKDFQVLQKSKEKLVIFYTSDIEVEKSALTNLSNKIKDHCGNVEIQFENKQKLDVSKNGKYKFVIKA